MRRLIFRALGASLFLVAALASCTSTPDEDTTADFCNQIRAATGALGAEATLPASDPARLTRTVEDLRSLTLVAPGDIKPTLDRMVVIFDELQNTQRDEVRNVLVTHELELASLSGQLTDYTLDTCGVILARAPATPTPVPASIDVTE